MTTGTAKASSAVEAAESGTAASQTAAAKAPRSAATKPAAKPAAPRKRTAKPAAGAKAAPAAAALQAAKPSAKLVRDSFTMPQSDFALIAQLKSRAIELKRPTKKSELLRAGLHALAALPPTRLHSALEALTPLKAGRPKKAS